MTVDAFLRLMVKSINKKKQRGYKNLDNDCWDKPSGQTERTIPRFHTWVEIQEQHVFISSVNTGISP